MGQFKVNTLPSFPYYWTAWWKSLGILPKWKMLTILPLDMNKLEPGPFQNLHIIAQYGEIHLEYLNLNDLYMQMCQYI